MSVTRIVKLFRNGASQAVRLPADFRFEGTEIFAIKDECTGDVVLTTQPGRGIWSEFFQLAHTEEDDDSFMSDRPMNVPPRERELFRTDA